MGWKNPRRRLPRGPAVPPTRRLADRRTRRRRDRGQAERQAVRDSKEG